MDPDSNGSVRIYRGSDLHKVPPHSCGHTFLHPSPLQPPTSMKTVGGLRMATFKVISLEENQFRFFFAPVLNVQLTKGIASLGQVAHFH